MDNQLLFCTFARDKTIYTTKNTYIMSKKKVTEDYELTVEDLQRFVHEWQNMSDDDRDIVKQMMREMLGSEDSNEPDDLNAHYYTYKGPEQYNQGSKRVPKWLKKIWDADYDDWLQLCHDTADKGKDMTDEKRSSDIRKYLCMLIDEFYNIGYPEQDPIRLVAPLWLIEHYHLTDCLDMALELLRQDAWFYTAYIDYAPQCLSAVLYQIGCDHTDKLREMLYEEGLVPLIKPIVFNALIWVILRQPQQRLATVAMLLQYLNHCLKICKRGASARNIPGYAYALAYAHIDEARAILKRLFKELKGLDMETFQEIEAIYDDPTGQLEGSLFDSVNGYLNHHDETDDFFDDENEWDDNEDDWRYDKEEPDDTSIYDRWKQRKRYTVRLELLDAPCTVERTVQVPSNLRLDALAQLILLAFGRKDAPSEYIYEAGDRLYPNNNCHAFTLGILLKKKNQSALFNIYDREHEAHWQHGLTLEKSADYSDRTTSYMTLLDGRGTYPSKNVADMEAYIQRFLAGKLRQPNFKTVRQHIRDFEEQNTIM